MAHHIGIASDYLNLFQRMRAYLKGWYSCENEVMNPGNSGDGYIKDLMAKATSVAETWTLTCTVAGPGATFTVTGSVTGADGTVTSTNAADGTNTYYFFGTHIGFLLIDGPGAWQIGDSFTFDVVANSIPATQQWTEMKYAPGTPQAGKPMNVDVGGGNAVYANELYMKAPGLAQADEDSDYYNISMCGALGFETIETYTTQPGKLVGGGTSMALWQFQIPYWIVADGRRMIITCKISTNFMSAYAGFILPYATPSEYPYPLYVGGPYEENSGLRWSSESHNHRSFFDPCYGYIYTIEGTWLLVRNKYASGASEANAVNTNIWPYTENIALYIRQSPGDIYPMLPMVLHTDQNGGNVYGELSGCFWTPGFANASENTIVVNGTDYVVLQDVYRTSNLDYYALKLD
jgi:hypothetical protein